LRISQPQKQLKTVIFCLASLANKVLKRQAKCQRNINARSNNHRCRGKSNKYIYYESVYAASFI